MMLWVGGIVVSSPWWCGEPFYRPLVKSISGGAWLSGWWTFLCHQVSPPLLGEPEMVELVELGICLPLGRVDSAKTLAS